MFHDSLHLYIVRERFRMDSNDTAGVRDHFRSGIGSFLLPAELEACLGRRGGEYRWCSPRTTISIISYVVFDLFYSFTLFLYSHLTNTYFPYCYDAFSGLSNSDTLGTRQGWEA
ncbi:hypothetical protein BO70DRAFT_87610 [Aspergillus heteromorphus CBS 117.55]|uniref:Uncharacterized protein n=1 Tax=Aspergillus heteromorphus CBS 117.55 TaxID=1448321 RepID=A0A317WXP6_9EURO|nr:uncharacterized protein BO70DRAFT_87610 [Aspergillus heteromorphus CBS 117.55]PWY91196.1 hypothetical protein BO70DRAFT_87610 [Aspergillus heteromorphus CBS 117.55]